MKNKLFRTGPNLNLVRFIIATLLLTSNAAALPGATYVYPLIGTRVSSDFGTRKHPVLRVHKHHNGIDLAAPEGALIRVVNDGVVVFSDPHAGYGNLLVVKHRDGITTHYGHCRTISVKVGDKVLAGQPIGTVGSTGLVSGPHLHFEIRIKGKPQNPEKFIPGLASEGVG